MIVDRSRPLATVYFFTENANLVARGVNDPSSPFDNDVIEIQTNRDMGSDSPTFNITLTRRQPWHEYVAANDLLIITMNRPPEKEAAIFVGIVDDSRLTMSIQNGAPSRVISITGRGVAKAFIDFDIGVVPEAEANATNIGWLTSNGVNIVGESPSSVLTAMWNIMAKKYITYSFGTQKESLWNLVQPNFTSRPGARIIQGVGLINYQGSMLQFMKQVQDSPFHEFYWEMNSNNMLEAVLRPTPFNPDLWNALPKTTITDDDIVMEDYGRSDMETYTLFSVGCDVHFSSSDTYSTLGTRPYWYKPYADKYGIRRLQVECLSIPLGSKLDVNTQNQGIMFAYQKDLYNWNIKNNFFYNGTILVKGSNRFKVGTRLFYTDSGTGQTIEFYIQSVSHDFMNYGAWVTNLGVIRGCDPTQRFTAPWSNNPAQYTGLGWAAASPASSTVVAPPPLSATQSYVLNLTSAQTDVVNYALGLMNNGYGGKTITYQLGGPGIAAGAADCSQFTQFVYQNAIPGDSINIGNNTWAQVKKGLQIQVPYDSSGNLDTTNLQGGDLIFFKNTTTNYENPPTHVGIWVGGGDFVALDTSANSIKQSTLSGDAYWQPHFYQARRVLYGASPPGQVVSGFIATEYGGDPSNGGAGTAGSGGWLTASGAIATQGVTVAVDPTVIPLGTKLKIECPEYPSVNGSNYIAQDTGSLVIGKHIDIYYNDYYPTNPALVEDAGIQMRAFGKRAIKVTIIS